MRPQAALRAVSSRSRRATVIAHRSTLDSAPRARVIVAADAVPVPGATIHHPDIVAECPCGKCTQPIIVEIDGSWHATKPGGKATDRRNRAYRSAGLQFVAVPTYEYPMDTWHTFLQRSLRRHLGTGKRSRRR